MKFFRYHALGNDYLVARASEVSHVLTSEVSQRICHRNFGIGSDGILVHEDSEPSDTFRVRIINPDGSEAEKSGNGLRIFARYLWDNRLVSEAPFEVDTAGGRVTCKVAPGGRSISVDMGQVRFSSSDIPVVGAVREVINEELVLEGQQISFCAATVGNPHCVVTNLESTEANARRFGPLLEIHPNFPNRTNVQFLKVIDRSTIAIEIWERGAGYTLASGSSSSAAAAVARRLGLVDDRVTVRMPGGEIGIEISADYSIRMTGSVTRVGDITLSTEAIEDVLS
jgi:diaminopimelate epimerase